MTKSGEFWSVPLAELFEKLSSSESGLSTDVAKQRLFADAAHPLEGRYWKDLKLFWSQLNSPLSLILIGAVILALFLGDYTNSIIVLSIILLSSVLGFVQERNAGAAIEALQKLVQVTASVKRDDRIVNIPIHEIVPGDIVLIAAGDVIPGDGRLISCNDLHINEATLTGESFPREKSLRDVPENSPLGRRHNAVFKGTSVVNGTGVVLIVTTDSKTVLGQISTSLNASITLTAFEKGTRQFGYLLLQLTLTFSLVILLLNLYMKKPVIDSALFALALAIGITPELLPAIITISLSTGARRMAEKKVIVKKLSAIHNLGSLDTFCIDKTGTLTEGVVRIYKALDVFCNESDKVLQYAVYNARYETGFSNPMDEALRGMNIPTDQVTKLDEVPYDFIRKRLSVVVTHGESKIMITKGAVKNITSICSCVEYENEKKPFSEFKNKIEQDFDNFGAQGFRTIGVCYKDVSNDPVISKEDEAEMIFLGFILLFDPPKENVAASLKRLHDAQVAIKLVTGDNAKVATHLGNMVGLDTTRVVTGSELMTMTEEALAFQLTNVSIFAETEPNQKDRIVRTLQKTGRTVGFLGDGINDVSAMRTADVGISVDSATDVAKETADIVLLEKDLDVLCDGIIEGRKTFINSLKYIFITTSANFGNMFSVAASSMFLTFLPLLPKQILLINFLCDIPAMALASDDVDVISLKRPRKWNNKLIRNFMIVFGFQSTIFDFLTFFVLYYIFQSTPEEFRTGWFLESVITQLFILMVIRTSKPFFRSVPGKYLLSMTIIVGCFAIYLPYGMISSWMGFAPPTSKAISIIIVIMAAYITTAEITKRLFFRNYDLL